MLGYLVGRVVISLLFIPQYFRGELFTAYQLIDRRFGPVLHKFTAGLFRVWDKHYLKKSSTTKMAN